MLIALLILLFPSPATAPTQEIQQYNQFPSVPCETVRCMIASEAQKYGVDARIAHTVAYCESNNNPSAKNANSSAAGVYQITRATMDDAIRLQFTDYTREDVFNARRNIEVAMWYMSKGQLWRWNASKHCWL